MMRFRGVAPETGRNVKHGREIVQNSALAYCRSDAYGVRYNCS